MFSDSYTPIPGFLLHVLFLAHSWTPEPGSDLIPDESKLIKLMLQASFHFSFVIVAQP